MYYPYFRGKTFELAALKQRASLAAEGRILPIIEPVDSRGLLSAFKTLIKANSSFLVVTNPSVGKFSRNRQPLLELLNKIPFDYPNITLGLILDDGTEQVEIDNFVKMYANKDMAFLHYGTYATPEYLSNLPIKLHIFDGRQRESYQETFATNSRVMISDVFNRKKNAEYPEDEFFSDKHLTFAQHGFQGFSDYLMVGSSFVKGFAPYAVAIHLTYNSQENTEIRIRHFVSDRKTGIVDTAGKFSESLAKLVRYYEANQKNLEFSESCKEFLQIHNDQKFPGLGYVKKLSMIHHLDLINSIL